MSPIASPKFSDVQAILDAIATADTSNPLSGAPHNTTSGSPFWRQTGTYATDYTAFTTGTVPNFGSDLIMDATNPMDSLFYQMLMGKVPGMPQMPLGGPYITTSGYSVTVNGNVMSGQDIQTTLQTWLNNGFPQ